MCESLELPRESPPSVSIALATFNGSRFLPAQLQSLKDQTLTPLELIVCDDQSSDDTVAIVEEFALNTSFVVRLRRNAARLGYRANFMQAAEKCSGQLIAFCDQDDYWHPTKLAKMVAQFDEADVLMAHHGAQLVSADHCRLGTLHRYGGGKEEVSPMSNSPWIFPLGFAQVFRRKLLDFSALRCITIDFHNCTEQCAHDQWIALLAYSLGKVRFVPDELVDYRQHSSNTVGLQYEGRQRPLLTRLMAKMNAHSDYKLLSQVIDGYADIFRIIEQDPLLVQWSDQARLASQEYRRLAKFYQLRAQAFSATDILHRFRSWMELNRCGAYSDSGWSFGLEERGRDFLKGVILARLHAYPHPDIKHDYCLKRR